MRATTVLCLTEFRSDCTARCPHRFSCSSTLLACSQILSQDRCQQCCNTNHLLYVSFTLSPVLAFMFRKGVLGTSVSESTLPFSAPSLWPCSHNSICASIDLDGSGNITSCSPQLWMVVLRFVVASPAAVCLPQVTRLWCSFSHSQLGVVVEKLYRCRIGLWSVLLLDLYPYADRSIEPDWKSRLLLTIDIVLV